MKRLGVFLLSLVCTLGVLGCGARSSEAAKPYKEEAAPEIISSDMLGQGIYDALKEDWDAWDALDEFHKMASSHMPGHCYKRFETREECEEFLGFGIFLPLEDATWPEKASYVGMPVGYNDAPRFYVSFYGTDEGQVQWIHVESGYRNGEIGIMVNAQVLVDSPKGNTDGNTPLITEDSGERYVAQTAVLARGPVTYSIRVIGEPNMQTQVKETLEQVLPYFTEETAGNGD